MKNAKAPIGAEAFEFFIMVEGLKWATWKANIFTLRGMFFVIILLRIVYCRLYGMPGLPRPNLNFYKMTS